MHKSFNHIMHNYFIKYIEEQDSANNIGFFVYIIVVSKTINMNTNISVKYCK